MSFGGAHAIAQGDVLAVLRELPDNSFDAILCDPPYGLHFMGKKWDYSVPSVDVWAEALRVLKPGAALITFGGTRTYHRMAVNIEDAGFELRDCLSWMYGSGFPKSLDVSKAIDAKAGAVREVVGANKWAGRRPTASHGTQGLTYADDSYVRPADPDITAPATELAQQWAGYGTALKPAWEPAILARKPLDGTVVQNVAKWGVGGLAIDACRIGSAEDKTPAPTSRGDSSPTFSSTKHLGGDDSVGRWPANVILDEEAGAVLDAQTGKNMRAGEQPAKRRDVGFKGQSKGTAGERVVLDSGGASRFFYSAKVSTREREHGCESIVLKTAAEMTESEDGQARLESPRTGAGRGGGARNHHPTLKPIALAKWLARLIMPPTPGAQLLVPFSGAGSEMIGALEAGWAAVFGIEAEQAYIDIANARIAAWAKGGPTK